MNLIIDIGNTAVKAGIFNQKKLIRNFYFKKLSDTSIKKIIQEFNPSFIAIASVGNTPDLKIKKTKEINLSFLRPTSPVPVKNLYKTPHSLGIDRIAAVVYATQYYQNQDCLIIDAGTCITTDFIDKKGYYRGGSISPGIKMRYKALHTFTANLPLLNDIRKVSLTGNSTDKSIKSGVLNGTLMEIKGIIQEYKALYPGLKILLTGGDQNFIKNQFKKEIFAISNMVLIGLNEILEYNKK